MLNPPSASCVGEIKVFADGVQVFNFIGGRWRLTNAAERYAMWQQAIGDEKLAQRFTCNAHPPQLSIVVDVHVMRGDSPE